MRAALLLADPDPHEPGYLSRNLASDGFDVVEAGWSAQALDIAERSRPDIVLAGEPELCARLREGEPGRRWDRNVPVRKINQYPISVVRRELICLSRSLRRRAPFSLSRRTKGRHRSCGGIWWDLPVEPGACGGCS